MWYSAASVADFILCLVNLNLVDIPNAKATARNVYCCAYMHMLSLFNPQKSSDSQTG